jgi:hypothetical protein
MNLNGNAQGFLSAFFREDQPVEGGFSFRDDLKALDLDFSLESLDRLDAFMDRLRETHQGREDEFIRDRANQNTLYLLAFYLGTLVGAQTEARVDWFSFDALVQMEPSYKVAGPAFYSSVMCIFNRTASTVGSDFFTLNTITTRIFDDDSKSARDIVEWSIGRVGSFPLPAFDGLKGFAGLTAEEKQAVRIVAPLWLDRDPMRRTFFRHTDIWNGGKVVWGRIVQANNLLFGPGLDDCPADVLYDTSGQLPYTALKASTARLFALRGGATANPEEKAFADHLNNELTRAAGMAVPRSVSERPLLVSTVLIHRPHLPEGKLSLAYFPVVMNEKHPGAIMVLPSRWWPTWLREHWTQARS